MSKIVLILASFFFFAVGAARSQNSGTPAAQPELRVAGDAQTPLQLTVSDLRKMPRKTLSVVSPHSRKKETYEGVLLEDILRKAGVPGGEQLRGKTMATYVPAEATDGYRVVFFAR